MLKLVNQFTSACIGMIYRTWLSSLRVIQLASGCAHTWLFLSAPRRSVTFLTRPTMEELKGRILVYSILGCPHCMRAKNTLHDHNLPYTDISLETYPQCREEVAKRTGKKTVPQVFFNNVHVGGNDYLQKLVEDKAKFVELVELVRHTAPPEDAPVPPDPSTAVKDADTTGFTCELDEYAKLVKEIESSGIIKDHRRGLKTHKNAFTGKAFIDWVEQNKGLDRERAREMGQELINQHFGHNVKSAEEFLDSADVFYRLLQDDESSALNAGPLSECEPRPVGELGEEIRKLILKIYNTFLSKDGKKVNYKGIGNSSEFETYVRLTRELHRVKVESATVEEKLSFFINIYNALVIHANVVRGPPVNLWQRYKFFNTVRYIIGGYAYSLQDIENGVLRGNRKGVGMIFRPFSKSDPRLKVALSQPEPLIHFALVCGAKSCPPIKTYSADGIFEQLALAAEAFLEGEDGCLLDIAKKEVKLSMIFKWYREDFGENNQQVAEFVCKHMGDGKKKSELAELITSGSYKVKHLPYDWGVNSS